MAESGLMSFIDIHERPRTDHTTFWEEAFRGNSSFPSGHVIPFSMLTFKVLQFYGPYAAIAPAAAALVVAFERINSEKHWSSDVIAGIGLSYFASEGVRLAANKRLGEKTPFSGGLIRYKDSYGPKIVYQF
jgi:membrane-associated phospholipid phosphatase